MNHRASRPTRLGPLSRAALAATALAATALTAAPAIADEPSEVEDGTELGTETETESSTDETTIVDETSTPQDTTPAPGPAATTDVPTDEVDETDGDVDEAEEIEPSYGFQKFRVGVKSSDGSFQQEGSTEGSVFHVTISPSEPFAYPGEDFECSTVEPDEPSADGTTYCVVEDEDQPDASRAVARASTGAVVPEDDELPEDQAFTAPPGSVVTVQQVEAADGLEITPDPVVLEPCTNLLGPFPVCGSGSDDGLNVIQSSTLLFTNDLVAGVDDGGTDDGDVSGDGAEDDASGSGSADDDAVLPDTGAPTGTLFGLGSLLVAAGVTLTELARRQRGQHRA